MYIFELFVLNNWPDCLTVSTLRVESECEDEPDGEEEVGGDQEDEQQQHEEHPQLPRHRGQLHHDPSQQQLLRNNTTQ